MLTEQEEAWRFKGGKQHFGPGFYSKTVPKKNRLQPIESAEKYWAKFIGWKSRTHDGKFLMLCFKGVSQRVQSKKGKLKQVYYRANLSYGNKIYYLGTFNSVYIAACAYDLAYYIALHNPDTVPSWDYLSVNGLGNIQFYPDRCPDGRLLGIKEELKGAYEGMIASGEVGLLFKKFKLLLKGDSNASL